MNMKRHDILPTSESKRRSSLEPPNECDIAIIGAGSGGLMAGALLALRGFRVAVFDHHYVAGGCTTQFARGSSRERYLFDVGLHYVGECEPDGMMNRLLSAAKVYPQWVPMDQDGFDILEFPDFTFPIPAGLDAFRERLVSFFPSERRGIDRYFRFVRDVQRISQRISKAGERLKLSARLWALFIARSLVRYQYASIADVLDDCTRNPELRAVLVGQNGDYGLPPSEVSALLHAGLVTHYLNGAWYPKGGGQVTSDLLAKQIEENGGSIHLRCGVARILVEQGRAVGIETEKVKGTQYQVRAKAVLSNADIRATLVDLVSPEYVPKNLIQRADQLSWATGIFMTYLGVRGSMAERGMRRANYWQFDSYDIESCYRVAAQADRPIVNSAYITSASLKDPETPHHAPDGVESVEIMGLLPWSDRIWGLSDGELKSGAYRKNPEYLSRKQALEQDLIARLERQFPGTINNISFRESATPVTHARYTRATNGSAYGIAATPDQFSEKRPGYRTPIEKLYLCGASTRAGHGIIGAFRSGYASARRIAADFDRPLDPLA